MITINWLTLAAYLPFVFFGIMAYIAVFWGIAYLLSDPCSKKEYLKAVLITHLIIIVIAIFSYYVGWSMQYLAKSPPPPISITQPQ